MALWVLDETETVDKKAIVDYCNKKQLLVEPKAIELLEKRKDYKDVIEKLVAKNEFIVNEQNVKGLILKSETKLKNIEKVEIKKTRFRPSARDIQPDFRIMEEYDVTGKTNSQGKVEDFLAYFKDKFEFLSSLLKNRQGFNAEKISVIEKIPKNKKIDVIGMVRDKWVSKNGHVFFKIEDFEAETSVWISKHEKQLNEEAGRIVVDDVIGIKGAKISNELIAAKEILYPDLPQRTFKGAERDVALLSASDIHVGSKLFMEKEFGKFISWLNGNANSEKELEKIGKIKYFVIVGDTVDGIGIYPDQHDELAIKDIYKQYDIFSNFIEQVPEYIEIFICPGQHDAVRRADPQPAIDKEYLPRLAKLKNVHLIGSPSWLEIEGLKTLVYHGGSMHDLFSSVNFLSYKEPQKAIVELLKRRDIMISYGMKQPYVPEHQDYMLIREEPDIYLGGDMHRIAYDNYRGCIIVNNSTFQRQTSFEMEKGHIPTPGIVPIIDLKTGNISEMRFAVDTE